MPAIKHSRTFGAKRPPHTVIIARGERVRHFTVSGSRMALGGALALLLTAAVGGGTWALLADQGVTAGAQPQSRLERDYERRIAALRAQLDIATSRQILAQKMVETKVDVLLDQQEELGARYDKLQPLLERAKATGLLSDPVPIPTPNPAEADADRSASGPDGGTAAIPSADSVGDDDMETPAASLPLRLGAEPSGLRTRQGSASSAAQRLSGLNPLTPSGETLRRIETANRTAERTQVDRLQDLAAAARMRAVKIASALRSGGIAIPAAQTDSARGGPFEPVPPLSPFDRSYAELDQALTDLQHVNAVADEMPLDRPMPPNTESSPFGVRPDPFLGRPAMHTGIDYAEPEGTVVHATAPGTVTRAGPASGYGNLVEIDHGDGISTRYGHLSRIDVVAGQKIAKGERIGAVGSTGRSTGPHLHYEVRRDGAPIDPQDFYRIGSRIASLD
ncbi:M23 family metallopeptidase [Jiella sp. M17.18]|uniref:M23 family metallopeptidase n=1 Tax=Jiella sp. M17.18 TaxID=3234247 RepID=UPI0034DDF65B